MWTYAKTDWKNGDWFDIENYNRIKDNIEAVYKKAIKMFKFFRIISIENSVYKDLCGESFFNEIEKNIESIAEGTYKPSFFEPSKRWIGNMEAWEHDDVNRIERMSLYYWELLNEIWSAQLITGTFYSGEDITEQLLSGWIANGYESLDEILASELITGTFHTDENITEQIITRWYENG